MKRALQFCLLLLSITFPVFADDSPAKKSETSASDALKAAPNDAAAWQKYLNEQFRDLAQLAQTKPDEAEKKLAEMKAFLDGITPEQPAAKARAQSAQMTLKSYEELIAVSRISLEGISKQLKDAPDDVKVLRRFVSKVGREIAPLARTEPEKAEKLLTDVKATFAAARDAATTEEAKKQYETITRTFSSIERSIESAKKQLAVIGKDAAPLNVETWLNGDALQDKDLKGKVVLIDFWAIWCGPCIATFPHLTEWNEKYEKKGLVMIGLTNYYKYQWDEKTNRPKRPEPGVEVNHDQEHEMLKKFAEHHKLKHRFGIQTDKSTAEFYGVTGIPHVVVIDREGKVRMMRVGSGEANAKDISQLLEKLLGGEKVAGN